MHVDELRAGSGRLRRVLRPPFASALRVLTTPKEWSLHAARAHCPCSARRISADQCAAGCGRL